MRGHNAALIKSTLIPSLASFCPLSCRPRVITGASQDAVHTAFAVALVKTYDLSNANNRGICTLPNVAAQEAKRACPQLQRPRATWEQEARLCRSGSSGWDLAADRRDEEGGEWRGKEGGGR
jgi:hypothetical protein